MKKTWKQWICIALTGALVSTAFAGCNPEQASAESMVSIDVNPSVSLVLDQNDKVLSVIAENEDAQVMIYETDFKGMSVENATKKLADLAVKYGYISEENRGVSVTAQGGVDLSKVQAAVENAFTQAANGAFTVNVTSDGLFSVNRELSMVNDEYNLNLTVGEYELIVRAQAADKSLTVDAAANMTTEELLETVYEHAEEFKPYMTEEYEKAKKSALEVYNTAKEELLNTCYVAPYVLKPLKYLDGVADLAFYQMYAANAVALEVGIFAAERVASLKEKTPIPETVQNAVAEQLGITEDTALAQFKEDIQDENGAVTLQSLEKYLNTYFKNMTADERAAAQAKFEEVLALAKTQATEVYDAVNAELQEKLGATIDELMDDVSDSIPDGLKTQVTSAVNEFKTTLNDVKTAIAGKEPLAAAYAALDTFHVKKAEKEQAVRTKLEANGDLESVDSARETLNTSLERLETAFRGAVAQAEENAKAWLKEKQTERTAKAQ